MVTSFASSNHAYAVGVEDSKEHLVCMVCYTHATQSAAYGILPSCFICRNATISAAVDLCYGILKIRLHLSSTCNISKCVAGRFSAVG